MVRLSSRVDIRYLNSLHRATVATADSWQQDIHSQYFFMICCLYTGQQSWQLTARYPQSKFFMICCLYTGQQSTQGNSRDSRQLTAWYPQSILFYYLLSLHSTTVVTADSWQHAIHSQYYFMISCLYTGQQSTQGNSRDSRQLTAWYPQSILFYYLLSLHSTTVMPAC